MNEQVAERRPDPARALLGLGPVVAYTPTAPKVAAGHREARPSETEETIWLCLGEDIFPFVTDSSVKGPARGYHLFRALPAIPGERTASLYVEVPSTAEQMSS
jgi:hypothetical protein